MRTEKLLTLFSLLAIIATLAFKFFIIFNSNIGFDEAGISYIALEMNSGKQLYTDYFDHKPPFMHYFLALIFNFVVPTTISIKSIALFIDIILILSVYFVSKDFLGKNYAFFAAALVSFFNLQLSMNTEILMTIFGLWGFFFYTCALKQRKITNYNLFIAGMLIAIAIWFKQSAVFFYIPIIFHIFYLNYNKNYSLKDSIRAASILTLGVLVISLPLLSYFIYKVGVYFIYSIIQFNLQFSASSSRIFQLGKGLNLLLSYLGIFLAIIISTLITKKTQSKRFYELSNNIYSSLIVICLFIFIFIFIGKEIFYQHFFQIIPFIIILAMFSIKKSEEKVKVLAVIILIFFSGTIFLSSAESAIREINNGDIQRQKEVVGYLSSNIPINASFFADNPVYTLLGKYKINEKLIGIAPTFSSVFDYSFICNKDYLVLTHRTKFLSKEESECIYANYKLVNRFEDVGESFVEVYMRK